MNRLAAAAVAFGTFLAPVWSDSARAERRVALVVGNSVYQNASPLANPTKDAQAYDLFLKGEFEQRVANSNFRPESFDQAARWYKEAIARDPNFALAIAQLAICQLRRHWLTDPLTDAEVMEAGRLAKQALTLAPDLAEAHVARPLTYNHVVRYLKHELRSLVLVKPSA